jgi:uncharacterized membrane protein YedE/YeeE
VNRPVKLSALAVGVVFGFLLTASGLGNYRTIHDGLLLRDPYIYLMMTATVGTAALGQLVLRRVGRTAFGGPLVLPRHPVRRQAVLGGAVFGVGFGVGAVCPGITVAAAATGNWYGVVVLAGILGGLWLRGYVEEREPRLRTNSAPPDSAAAGPSPARPAPAGER